ncbi:MAG TPA: hypothetical protein VGJ20_37030 [Xanthobacteraceae bacterium]|jgi:hypothetical protein
MQVDRRSFISLLALALGCPALAIAEQGQGLFWRLETHGRSAVLFGYLRLSASKGRSIVDDGIRIIEQTQSIIRDSGSFDCPTIHIGNDILLPLLPRLSLAVADEVRRALAASRIPQPQLERVPGYGVVMSLLGEGTEGEGDPIPSVGDLIFDRAIALRRPLTTLLADDEIRKIDCPTPDDVVAVNNQIDEKEMTSILNFRSQVGPIGAYIDRLYVGSKTDELALYFKYVADHDIALRPHESRESLTELLFTRLSAHLPSLPNPFVFLPVETLIGAGGILERFRQQGADVSVLA